MRDVGCGRGAWRYLPATLLLWFSSAVAFAQPPANPNLPGSGGDNDFLVWFGILLFTCPFALILCNMLGSWLYGKTNKPFWAILFRDWLGFIGVGVWIAFVTWLIWFSGAP
jgi:hypothetical protein